MEDSIKDRIVYRLQKSHEDLKAAKVNLKNRYYAQSLNRSYYTIFHAARALFALDKFESKTHAGVITFFTEKYVLTGKIEKKYSKILTFAEKVRVKSDYMDFFVASKEQAEAQIKNAEEFLTMAENYLSNVLEN